MLNKRLKKVVFPVVAVVCLTTGGLVLSSKPSRAAGTVPASVQTGIDNAIATVGALDSLALACLVVALTPLGAMLTLRFLNMVLSRV
jgi:hypothetical protein